MKKLSLILAIIMLVSCVGGAFAEGETVSAAEVMDIRAEQVDQDAAADEEEFLKSNCDFSVIEADETTGQIKLSYMEGVTPHSGGRWSEVQGSQQERHAGRV